MKLSARQRAALVVIQAQHRTNPGSYVLAKAVGHGVSRTLKSLVEHGLVEKVERPDIRIDADTPAYAYQITPAGRTALEAAV